MHLTKASIIYSAESSQLKKDTFLVIKSLLALKATYELAQKGLPSLARIQM